jgi:hypothetical protein
MSNDLFQPAPREKAIQDAVVGGKWASRHPYIHGYYLAARELVESALGDEPQDALFYPICFNYRHYLELHLKGLIRSLGQFYQKMEEYGQHRRKVEELENDDLQEHSLHVLLNLFKKRLEAVSEEPLDSNVRSTIMELHRTDDPRGQTFRYHRNTSGEPTIPERKHVDLANLAEQMEKVHKHLIGIDSWIDYQHAKLDEMIEAYRSAMPDLP